MCHKRLRKLIDEVKMKCFVDLAQTLNFSSTARQLFMTQQAVSKNIATLEKEWGIKLFDRNTRNVSLTPEGEELYEIVSKFSSHLDATITRLKKATPSSGLRVGYQYYLKINEVVHDSLRALQESHPEVTLDGNKYSPPILNELFQAKTLELIILYERFLYSADISEYKVLAEFPKFIMVSENYPSKEYSDIVKAPFIIDNFEGTKNKAFEERLEREIDEFGLKPSEIIVVPDRDSAYTYAELGRGVIVGTEQSHIIAGRIFKQYSSGQTERLVAAWHKDEKNPLIKQYVNLLKKGFAQE